MTTRNGLNIGAVAAASLIIAAAAPGSVRPAAPSSASSIIVGTVRVVGNLHVRRFDHTATLLPSGKVLIAGGLERNHHITASAELYDPASRRFSAVGSMRSPRFGHTATLLATGKVLIAGGCDGASTLGTAELYDPATGAFAATGDLRTARCGAPAVLLRSGKVLVIGGDGMPDANRLASAELYDPASGRFAPTGSMRTPRDQFAAVRMNSGAVIVLGGASAGRYPGSTIEASAEIFDPAMEQFKPTGPMAARRYKLGAALLADGRVLVAGGSDNRDWRGQLASVEAFDPQSGSFTVLGNMRAARFKLARGVVQLPDGRVLIASGAEQPEVFDPVSGVFRAASGAPLAGFYFSSVTLLQDGSALIAGGYGGDPQAGGVASAALYVP